jgi:hypothetical protein
MTCAWYLTEPTGTLHAVAAARLGGDCVCFGFDTSLVGML